MLTPTPIYDVTGNQNQLFKPLSCSTPKYKLQIIVSHSVWCQMILLIHGRVLQVFGSIYDIASILLFSYYTYIYSRDWSLSDSKWFCKVIYNYCMVYSSNVHYKIILNRWKSDQPEFLHQWFTKILYFINLVDTVLVWTEEKEFTFFQRC